jgi:diaminopropionate ammonia-lyase
VSEPELTVAPDILSAHGGPPTTPSGAASLAGAIAARQATVQDFGLDADSHLLILVTEGALASVERVLEREAPGYLA